MWIEFKPTCAIFSPSYLLCIFQRWKKKKRKEEKVQEKEKIALQDSPHHGIAGISVVPLHRNSHDVTFTGIVSAQLIKVLRSLCRSYSSGLSGFYYTTGSRLQIDELLLLQRGRCCWWRVKIGGGREVGPSAVSCGAPLSTLCHFDASPLTTTCWSMPVKNCLIQLLTFTWIP